MIIFAMWKFRELQLTEHTGVVSVWLEGLRPRTRARKVRQTFRARLMGMTPLNRDQWPDSWVKKLKGYDEVFELRFKVLNIQQRPLFFFGLQRFEITFVFPEAEEASDEFVPRDAPGSSEGIDR